jgi:hypothetical protein
MNKTQTTEETTKGLSDMLVTKYNQARANGATVEQAIKALRSLWLEAAGA